MDCVAFRSGSSRATTHSIASGGTRPLPTATDLPPSMPAEEHPVDGDLHAVVGAVAPAGLALDDGQSRCAMPSQRARKKSISP